MRDVFIRYKKAAEEGHDLAQYMVGLMYANGDGVDKDVKLAMYWYKKAMEQGHADAKHQLKKLRESTIDDQPYITALGTIAKDKAEEQAYSSVAELVEQQMMIVELGVEEKISGLSNKKKELYFAFELGVIEFFDGQFLNSIDAQDKDIKFFNFLIYYQSKKYGHSSDRPFDLWQSFATKRLYITERKLGFDSVNNSSNIGHFPSSYLLKAFGTNS